MVAESRAADRLPHAPHDGSDRAQLDQVFSIAYEELRRLASSIQRGSRGVTLTPTALVNEAWIKLSRSPHVAHTSVIHFKRIAARAMRQVIVEAARRRHAAKRGGPDAAFVTLDDQIGDQTSEELLGLDAALERLARLSPRQAAMVEARFFGGLEMAEIAAALDVSEATLRRDWRAARAWLASELKREG